MKIIDLILTRIALRAAVLMAFVFGVVSAHLSVAADATPFLGQWDSITFEGAGPVNKDQGCQTVAWTDREIKLEPIAGNPTRVRGEWVRSYQALWMSVNGETCRFPGETKFEPNHLAVIGWTLAGTYDAASNSLKVSGTYSQCTGNSCPLFQTSARDFQTELIITNGEVVDVDPTLKPELHKSFIPRGAENPKLDSALRELKPILAAVDANDGDRVYEKSAAITKSQVTKEQMRAGLSQLHSNTGSALSRSVMNKIYAIYGPNNDTTRKEFAVIMNIIYFTQNRSGIEYSILEREDGQWKMGYYWVGGKVGPPQ